MARDEGWNRSIHYHEVLLRSVPPDARRALEVGCGEGRFARSLARKVEHVDALDLSPDVIARAEAASVGAENIRWVVADFMTHPIDQSAYDFVGSIATLHHLPFGDAISRMKDALRPGGTLGILGLYRESTLRDYVTSAVALPVSTFHRLTHAYEAVSAPLAPPELTLREIEEAAANALPGSVVTRHLLWRYSLLWRKPALTA